MPNIGTRGLDLEPAHKHKHIDGDSVLKLSHNVLQKLCLTYNLMINIREPARNLTLNESTHTLLPTAWNNSQHTALTTVQHPVTTFLQQRHFLHNSSWQFPTRQSICTSSPSHNTQHILQCPFTCHAGLTVLQAP